MQKQQICQLFSPHNEFIGDISELTSTDVYKHCEITEEMSSQRSMSDGLSERWAYNWINSKMRARDDVRLCGLFVSEQMQEESPTDGR